MMLRLAILNIASPIILLIALGFIPEQGVPVPAYLMIALIIYNLGRAFLLLQQQTIFSLLPLFILTAPDAWVFGFDVNTPFTMQGILLYCVVVNLQWGQRPWFHKVYWFNFGLIIAVILLGCGVIPLPASILSYQDISIFWLGLAMIVLVLLFSVFWERLGRWAALWPLIGVWAYALNWGEHNYVLLWAALASMVTLTIDSYAMAFVDELTGIPGRRAMEFKLKTLGGQYFIAMADVDFFKKFNDNHGHQVGDDVLKMVATVLSKTKKATAYRYGGEEFVLVFSHCDSEDVYHYLEETRAQLEAYDLYPKSQGRLKGKRGKGSERKPLHITASFGVAKHKGSEPQHQVISRADKALYKAKENGRNRVEIAK